MQLLWGEGGEVLVDSALPHPGAPQAADLEMGPTRLQVVQATHEVLRGCVAAVGHGPSLEARLLPGAQGKAALRAAVAVAVPLGSAAACGSHGRG